MQETKYQPADIETRIHAAWEKADAFKAGTLFQAARAGSRHKSSDV